MKIQTKELTDAALDLLVATCEGHFASISESGEVIIMREGVVDYFDPHRNWGWGGPIIEREHIALDYYHTPIHPDVQPRWEARHGSGVFEYGPTPLIAAMRSYVASKLGDEVEVPDELT